MINKRRYQEPVQVWQPGRIYRWHQRLDRCLDGPEMILLRAAGLASRRALGFLHLMVQVKRRASRLPQRLISRRFASNGSETFLIPSSSQQPILQYASSPSFSEQTTPRLDLSVSSDSSVDHRSGRGDRFVFYRIIGNDLYPRHDAKQSLDNLHFILKHEPTLEGCEKRWLLNRLRDSEKERQLEDLLSQHGYGVDRIPFNADEFISVPWDWSCLPTPDFLGSNAFRRLLRHERESYLLGLFRKRNLYLMNNNGARNQALELGRRLGDWILPWDGNCFVTAEAWRAIRVAVMSAPQLDYFWSPMQRIGDNTELLSPDFLPDPQDEPQLVFHRTATEFFNPAFAYGRRPKVELFWRLGLKGPWDRWLDEPWDQPRRPSLSPLPELRQAGWVARLHSGVVEQGQPKVVLSQRSRYSARNLAIKASINAASRSSASGLSRGLLCEPSPTADERPSPLIGSIAAVPNSLILLSNWWAWTQGEESRVPMVTAPELLAHLNLLIFQSLNVSPIAEATDFIERLARQCFTPGPFSLKPALRLLRRKRRPGQLLGSSMCSQSLLQVAYMADLLSAFPRLRQDHSWIQSWQSPFEAWLDELLASEVKPNRMLLQLPPVDPLLMIRYEMTISLLSNYRCDPTEPVDAILRAMGHLRALSVSSAAFNSVQRRQELVLLVLLIETVARRLGILEPALVRELELLRTGHTAMQRLPHVFDADGLLAVCPPHWIAASAGISSL